MINKNKLQSFISKYYLNEFNQAKWVIKDNKLAVHVGSGGVAAGVYINDFPIKNAVLGVYDSSKLQKLIGITSGDLLLGTESQGELSRKLLINDANFELSYSLSSPEVIPKINWFKDVEWDMELDLSRDDIDNLLKAKNAFYNAYQLDFNKSITEDALFSYAKLSYELDFNPYAEAEKSFTKYYD